MNRDITNLKRAEDKAAKECKKLAQGVSVTYFVSFLCNVAEYTLFCSFSLLLNPFCVCDPHLQPNDDITLDYYFCAVVLYCNALNCNVLYCIVL